MNLRVQLLDIDKDHELFIEAYQWRETAPRWFQACLDIWKEPLEEHLVNAVGELHYGVWHEDRFVATIRLIPEKMDHIFNIHLSAKKGTDFEVLYVAGCTLRDFVFSHGHCIVYGYLPSLNKSISLLYESLGFNDTGIRIFKGVIHGKLIEWKHYAIVH